MPPTRLIALGLALLGLTGCGRLSEIGRPPDLTPAAASDEARAMTTYGLGEDLPQQAARPTRPRSGRGRAGRCWATGARCSAATS